MSRAELVFAPLGGCREIGMNLNAYGYGPPENRRWYHWRHLSRLRRKSAWSKSRTRRKPS